MDNNTLNRGGGTLLPMVLIGILFFVFGFVTWLNGALIPFLKIACELNELQAYLVAFVFYIAYFVMALPMSGLLTRFGYRAGLQIGLGVMASGALLFIPAALSHTFGLFLLALFVLGTGLTYCKLRLIHTLFALVRERAPPCGSAVWAWSTRAPVLLSL